MLIFFTENGIWKLEGSVRVHVRVSAIHLHGRMSMSAFAFLPVDARYIHMCLTALATFRQNETDNCMLNKQRFPFVEAHYP